MVKKTVHLVGAPCGKIGEGQIWGKEKILIVAGNINQAAEYARINNIRRENFVYIMKDTDLFGFRDRDIIVTGTSWTNDNFEDIKARAMCTGCTLRFIQY